MKMEKKFRKRLQKSFNNAWNLEEMIKINENFTNLISKMTKFTSVYELPNNVWLNFRGLWGKNQME